MITYKQNYEHRRMTSIDFDAPSTDHVLTPASSHDPVITCASSYDRVIA